MSALFEAHQLEHLDETLAQELLRRFALNPGPFTEGEAGFHELAAGLFMVGYDLG